MSEKDTPPGGSGPFDKEQYNKLISCEQTGDFSEWNGWVDEIVEKYNKASIPEINLRGAPLAKRNLKGVELQFAKLEGAKLEGADLREANLSRAKLEGADLREANLSRAYLIDADLKEAKLGGAKLEGAYLEGAYLEGAYLIDADLIDADLKEAKLEGAYLIDADLKEAKLEGAKLEGAKLVDADLKEAKLGGAKLEGADLREANLSKADLSKANLSKANLSKANLSKANLSKADLSKANLKWTNLSRAYFGANLEGADLRKARLYFGANLEGADLEGANLEGADLREANLEGAIISNAKLLGTDCSRAVVNGQTMITNCEIDGKTDFTGVGLSGTRVDPELRTRLLRNIRKKQWENWYAEKQILTFFKRHGFLKWMDDVSRDPPPSQIHQLNVAESASIKQKIKAEFATIKTWIAAWMNWFSKYPEKAKAIAGCIVQIPDFFINLLVKLFWWISDYGSSTKRIIIAFFALNGFLTLIYSFVHLLPMTNLQEYTTGLGGWLMSFLQTTLIPFSIMDIGLEDINLKMTALMTLHVVLGYVILAALVTRIAIMFQDLNP